MESEPWICRACGQRFDSNPRVERLLHGSLEHVESGNLCWVCARLFHSVRDEASAMRRQFEEIGGKD